MGTLDDATQKIKGKAQQAKGNIEHATGHEGKSMWDKAKGKFNETVGDAKLNSRSNANDDEE
jgi:uncharacterized protein YjbJ (UPF0337 family)